MISELKSRKVGELMSRYPVWVRPEQSFNDSLEIMHMHKVSHLPVCEGSRIVGMISKTDLLDKAILIASNSSGRMYTKNQLESLENQTIMTSAPIFIKEKDSEEDAKSLMLSHSIHALPVVNDELEIRGILTFYDLIK
jgi:CBS domain-containing protein